MTFTPQSSRHISSKASTPHKLCLLKANCRYSLVAASCSFADLSVTYDVLQVIPKTLFSTAPHLTSRRRIHFILPSANLSGLVTTPSGRLIHANRGLLPTTMDLLSPPTNYIGTALFFSYILAALVLTARVLLHLHTLHFEHLSHDTSPAAAARFATLATCAVVLFATLSYHMLSFLLASYTSFCEARGLLLLPATAASVSGQLWIWMLASTLFSDFARDLVVGGTAASRAWAQTALVWSLGVSVFIGVEGKRRWRTGAWGAEAGEVVALAQVLPVSFALVLWLMGDVGGDAPADAGQGATSQESKDVAGSTGAGEERGADAKEEGVEVGAAVPAAVGVYVAVLPVLSRAAEESMTKLIGAVFLLRACLAVPYLASRPAVKGSAQGQVASLTQNLTCGIGIAGGLVQLGLVWSRAVKESDGWVEIVEGLWETPAVGAMSMDAVFGAFSAVAFALVE